MAEEHLQETESVHMNADLVPDVARRRRRAVVVHGIGVLIRMRRAQTKVLW